MAEFRIEGAGLSFEMTVDGTTMLVRQSFGDWRIGPPDGGVGKFLAGKRAKFSAVIAKALNVMGVE